jgi:hypothetical protein
MAHPDRPDGAAYETRDVGPRGIVLLGAVLIAVTAGAMFMLWWLFDRLDMQARRADPPVTPLAEEAAPPPGPQLEVKLSYSHLTQASQDKLKHYGWVDKPQGVAQIPIERAMQILAERGLPEPSGPVQPPASSTDAKP